MFILKKKLDKGYLLIYSLNAMGNDKKAVLLRLDLSLYYKIKELSEKESRTILSVIRQATKEFIERREPKADTK